MDKPGIRDDLRAALRTAPDMARALGRLSLGRGQPRDAVAIRLALEVARAIRRILGAQPELPPSWRGSWAILTARVNSRPCWATP
ncbi:hypothetical protein RAA17_08055 [Komagataeibacter rhaeticus]|nr:hypothetical protein [Komagataeibacter rhaeticus]